MYSKCRKFALEIIIIQTHWCSGGKRWYGARETRVRVSNQANAFFICPLAINAVPFTLVCKCLKRRIAATLLVISQVLHYLSHVWAINEL